MNFPVRTYTLVLALCAAAAIALPAQGALAAGSPGGASAPAASAPAATAPSAHRIRTSGIATWFGPGFYGQQTACGQVLTPEVVGVAHRTLPCGTLVRVTYAHRSITVPVVDRGPYSFADWDLTAGAARALGVSDTIRVRTKVVGRVPNTPSLGLPAPTATQSRAGGAVAG
jgi:rare lipoprotein A (peptidoglycan hydrolase)